MLMCIVEQRPHVTSADYCCSELSDADSDVGMFSLSVDDVLSRGGICLYDMV